MFLFHINFILYHWLLIISVQTDSFKVRSDFIQMYVQIVFALCCLRRNYKIHNKEHIFISYTIFRVANLDDTIGQKQ